MTTIREINPIQGLLDYARAIKPFHTKIVEELTEYTHTESVIATVTETLATNIELTAPSLIDAGTGSDSTSTDTTTTLTIGGYGGGVLNASTLIGGVPFGALDPLAWPVISNNFNASGPLDSAHLGYDTSNQTVILPGDRTAMYSVGNSIEVIMYETITNTKLSTNSYLIQSSEFVVGDPSTETPHTIVTTTTNLQSISSAAGTTPASNVRITVTLTPFSIASVILGYGTASEIVYTDVPPSPGLPQPTPQTQIDASYPNETVDNAANSFIITGDVSNIFATGSIVELVGTQYTFHILTSIYDGTQTTIRVVETIPTNRKSNTLKIRELVPGYDEALSSTTSTADGNIAAIVTDRISFSWSDPAESDVLDGYQFLIQSTSGSVISVNGFAEDSVTVGDRVIIFDNINAGIYTVNSISKSTITLNSSLTDSVGGYVEKYEP